MELEQRLPAEVHEIASRGFEAEAEAYDRARPSYPADATGWLAGNLGIGPGRRVMDLAAGTGKLTVPLAGLGARLVAVEPVAGMRARLRARLPGTPVIAGVAEALPFAAGSLDAVVVAQAFHWFDADRALNELARVIRPGGRLGLIWNARDRRVDWVDQVWSVMDRVEHDAPWRGHGDGKESATRMSQRAPWSDWVEATFFHAQVCSPADVVDRIRSVSHIAVLPRTSQREILDEVRSIIDAHVPGQRRLAIPYRVDAMYAERRT